jgi:putative membrane protein
MCGAVSRKEHTMMMWYGGDWGWASWILMAVGMVAFWALVITAVVLAVRYLAGPRGTAASPSGSVQAAAEGVLDQRFARGEIDENEYRQRLSLLREYP